ncbi:hypothetical protein EBR56_00780 [bacterium]|nr:hypothetical protein [bacterium]
MIEGRTPFGSWGGHLDAWRPVDRPRTLLLRFEDLAERPQRGIDAIAGFLSRAPVAAWHNDLERLRTEFPGFFRSGLLDTWHFTAARESREARRRMDATRLDSEAVARRVRRAIDRDERYVIEGLQARCLWRLKRFAPRTATALLRRLYRRLG